MRYICFKTELYLHLEITKIEVRMDYRFEIMTQEEAEEIAYKWQYDDKYSFYDIQADEEDLKEFLDPHERRDTYYTVFNSQNEIVGYFSYIKTSSNTVDIALGMNPVFAGKGKGNEFLRAGIEYAGLKYDPIYLTLAVTTFNHRAIKVYKRAGFIEDGRFVQKIDGERYEYIKMLYKLKP